MLRVGSEFSKVVEGYAAYGETISVPGTKRLREIVVESCEAMDVEMHANHDGGQRIRTWSGKDLERKLLYALVPAFGADGVTEHSISAALFEMLKSIGPGRLWLLDGRVHLLTARAADSVPDGRTTTRSGSDGDHLTLAMYYWHEPRTMTDKDGELYWNGVKLTTDVTATNPWSVVDDALKREAEKVRAADYAKIKKAPKEPGRRYVQAVQPALRNGHTTVLNLVIPEGHEGVMVKVVSTGWCLGAMSWDQEKKECSDCLLELVKHNARHATLYIRSSHYYAWSAQVEYRECAKAAEYYAKLTATCTVLRQRAAAAAAAAVPAGEYSAPGEPLRVKMSVQAASPPDPLDQVIDEVKLRNLVEWNEGHQREQTIHHRRLTTAVLTPAQRAAVSAHWSAQLRAKVEASRAAAAESEPSVRYCEVEPWE